MNNNDIKNLFKKFIKDDWKLGNINNEKVLIYDKDTKLTLRLTGKCLRNKDSSLSMDTYDGVFNKYHIEYVTYCTFYYDDVCIDDYKCTLLGNGHTLIPIPVGANMLNKFYKNEYNIAKAFSDENFNKLINGYEIYAEYSRIYE